MARTNLILLLICTFLLVPVTISEDTSTAGYVQATDDSGESILVPDDRQPSLYTQKFGDCLGSSSINVTRFDVAYYQDNMTVLFHLEGSTNIANDSLMMYIGVFAYGLSRFNLVFNPCSANIYSLCPMNRSIPILANGIIPVSPSDVAGIPPIALNIPDFEGQAILRVFSNSTETEIGCYSGLITNGASFSHPTAVGTVLGLFTLAALGASFVTAIYGDHLSTMRTHHAHSLSIFVVFAVLQHIYFTGVLSMNWPSVLVAWWSNFAWSGGMIYSRPMQNSINQLLGSNRGNISEVGAAGTGTSIDDLAGGYSISSIYKRSNLDLRSRSLAEVLGTSAQSTARHVERMLSKRDASTNGGNASNNYPWYGSPVAPGLPIPGNFSGFAGTLSSEDIPVSNAFMTGFLWFLILICLIGVAVVICKWSVEGLIKAKLIKTERLAFFRAHWTGYTIEAILRIFFIGFFMMMLLALFQLSFLHTGGATAIAALVFIVFFVGVLGLAGYAFFYRLRSERYETRPEKVHIEKTKIFRHLPWLGTSLESRRSEKDEQRRSLCSFPWLMVIHEEQNLTTANIHQDEQYIKKFGWLSARFRRTKWWFFVAWLAYEFLRACFYGGAAGRPMTQVFGLLIIEILALVFMISSKPFEGNRLNVLMIYLLGISKVVTVALSAAFDARFGLQRITTTVIGIVIIVVQGILTICLLVAIVVGVVSSYMSLTRNRQDFHPKSWAGLRERYFGHLEHSAPDLPKELPVVEEPKTPYFRVNTILRQPKIEDDDLAGTPGQKSPYSIPSTARASRADLSYGPDTSYTTTPFGARVHRASWSTRDFESLQSQSARNSRHLASAGYDTRNHSSRMLPQSSLKKSVSCDLMQPVLDGTDEACQDSKTIAKSSKNNDKGKEPVRFGQMQSDEVLPSLTEKISDFQSEHAA